MTLRALLFAVGLLLVTAAQATAARDRWQRPVAGPALRSFALAADRFARGQHRGVDLEARLGGVVRAACGGRVSFAGSVPRGGRTVSVRCGRLIATYQQLGAVRVRRGQVLAPGTHLGAIGRSGDPRTRRPHLHLGAREAATGRYVDPLTLLGDAPPTLPPVPGGRGRARRPLPLGPAPAQPRVRPDARPVRVLVPVRVHARPVTVNSTPWVVWIGLLCVGLALPVGGLVRVRRRRRRSVQAPVAQTAV